MKKLNSKGFGFVGVFAVIVILAAAVGAGAYVYHKHHKASSATSSSNTSSNSGSTGKSGGTNQTPDPYAGWKTYSNSQISFKYPSTWVAGPRQSTFAIATSPTYVSGAVETSANPGSSITLFLQLSANSRTIDCADAPCQVSAVVPLSNSQLSDSVLAIVNQTSGNGTKFTEYVVASGNTKVGDTSVTPVKAGSGNVYVFGQPYYTPSNGELTVAARVTDAASFQVDSNFKNLVTLINSIAFN